MDERRDTGQAHRDELAEAFDAVWRELRSIVGSATAVALMRRAADMCAESCPRLRGINFGLEGNKIRYALPPESADSGLSIDEIASFTSTLLRLARSMAGDVFVAYLLKSPVIHKYAGGGYDESQQD